MQKLIGFISRNKRCALFALIFALPFMILQILGSSVDNFGTIFVKYNVPFCLIFVIIAYFFIFSFLKLLPFLKKATESVKIEKIDKLLFSPNLKSFILCFVFISIFYIPVFAAYFPGIFTYDTFYQVHFFKDADYREVHPLLHNLLVYGVVLFSEKFRTPVWGVFIYTFIQSLFMIFCFSYCIYVMSKYKAAFLIKLFALLFFAIYPVNPVMSLIATKDTFYTGFLLLFILYILSFVTEKENFMQARKNMVLLPVITVFMISFRMNAFLLYLLSLPFLLLFGYKNVKMHFAEIIVLFFIPVIFCSGFSFVKKNIGIKPPWKAASVGIPLQQTARARILHDSELSSDDKEAFVNLVSPYKEFSYFSFTADTMKFDSELLNSDNIENALRDNPKKYIDLYFKWAKKYPKTYIDAFFVTDYPYFYIPYKYKTFGLYYYLFTYNRWDDFYGTKIEMKSFNPKLKEVYDNIFLKASFNDNIFGLVLFSLSVNMWVFISALLILLYEKKYELILPLTVNIFMSITVLFAPLPLLRYVYPNYVIIPLLLMFCFWDKYTGLAKKF